MRRRGYRVPRRKLMLFPFMDIFFVVTVFFLSISVIRMGLASPGQAVGSDFVTVEADSLSGDLLDSLVPTASFLTPVAENGGIAHMFIQMMPSPNDGMYRYYDYSCYDGPASDGSTRPPTNLTLDDLKDTVRVFLSSLGNWQTKNIFAVILCPESGRYRDVARLRDQLDGVATLVKANVQNGVGPTIFYSLLVGDAITVSRLKNNPTETGGAPEEQDEAEAAPARGAKIKISSNGL